MKYYKNLIVEKVTHLRMKKEGGIFKEWFFGEEEDYFEVRFEDMSEINLIEFRGLLENRGHSLEGLRVEELN